MEQVTFKVLCAHHACDYFKAKYQVLKVIQYFDVELVLTASDVEYCAELHQFSGGYNVTVLADTPEQDLIAILNSLGILN